MDLSFLKYSIAQSRSGIWLLYLREPFNGI